MIFTKKLISLALLSVATSKQYFLENFDDGFKRWTVSSEKEDYGNWEVSHGKFFADEKDSLGLKTTEDYRFYSISTKLDKTLDTAKNPLVLQFSVKHEQSIDCGGGYVKLLPPDFDPTKFNGDSAYAIMFGPDICGGNSRTHTILNYKNENKLIKKDIKAETDQLTHLYTFVLNPDKTFKVLIDNKEVRGGKILDEFDLLPPKFIKDPKAKKPTDWIDEELIDDPNSTKPEGYDDIPETIVDPDSTKPEDWDDEEDGEWEQPRIPNPDYAGPWKPAQIKNPDYKGPWIHPDIDNPDYKEDNTIGNYEIGYIGFDLWQVKSGSIFDDILITDSEAEAKEHAEKVVLPKIALELKAKEKFDEAEIKRAEAEEAASKLDEPESEVIDEEIAEDEIIDDDGHDEL
ncbi:hypothetical protein HK099_001463 [Clydaea vesicula]|uniref:Calreticulin n=1 Tax=Clydaea vesicula TaxID=447962 RepID=A0AAD5U527_9FUNG|nr:hypothetical protein HK099_001463 [Clydaea vesicula]KAJ3394143.1 hypothetical protein HDU92_007209 [Lobulomyces angularis]